MAKVKDLKTGEVNSQPTEKVTVDNIGEAISVLVQAVHIAQAKGVFSFSDSTKVGLALQFIEGAAKQGQPQGPVTTEEVDKSKK